MDLGENQILLVLLNEQINKMTPKDILIYPLISLIHPLPEKLLHAVNGNVKIRGSFKLVFFVLFLSRYMFLFGLRGGCGCFSFYLPVLFCFFFSNMKNRKNGRV